MSFISHMCFLEQFVLHIQKNNTLFYSFAIKMQLNIIDLKKNSIDKKKHFLWFQAEAEYKAQSALWGCNISGESQTS